MCLLNFKLLIEYDGTEFHGWQSQRQERTVQDELEAALSQLASQQKITVIGAGRTDAGVHARGQVANVRLDTPLPAEQLQPALNAHLPGDIRIQNVELVSEDFNARRDALKRQYSYSITTAQPVIGRQYVWPMQYTLDRNLLRQCADFICGEHDFNGFAKANASVDSTVCQVEASRWELSESLLIYTIAANRFLHHMVRYLVGTMVEVARGRYSLDQFRSQLDGNPGCIIIYRAPAQGLVLENVSY